MTDESRTRTITALAWCLAWNNEHSTDKPDLVELHQMRQAVKNGLDEDVPEDMKPFVAKAQQLYDIDETYTPETLKNLEDKYPELWQDGTRIGLVFGGATKIKQYVFEATKINDIRGASALLDRINLDDIPGIFGEGVRAWRMSKWLDNNNFGDLREALIPELIIYSTGGSVLAFCPAVFTEKLSNAIEKRYTSETLTANSCVVGDTFRLLEFRFGLLQNDIKKTLWLDEYKRKQKNNPIIRAYFDQSKTTDLNVKFWERKNFNELVGKLANLFTHRRNGNSLPDAKLTSRAFPPIFETHPYLKRDETDNRSGTAIADNLPGSPCFSEALARKVIVGQRSKRNREQKWYDNKFASHPLPNQSPELWNPGLNKSWVTRFEKYLVNLGREKEYYQSINPNQVSEARSLREIGNVSKSRGFAAYIYADGNNMGGYIRHHIRTPQKYSKFSKQVLEATQHSVYEAIVKHLSPRQLQNLTDADNANRSGKWIHPFEIITIGGDDVLLIVPADKALDIAKTIGDKFEELLTEFNLDIEYNRKQVHRYQQPNEPEKTSQQCELSMSAGVLMTAEDTPIYYAEKLVSQLLKSSKKRAKELKRKYNYYGGTVDFLVLKAVTAIASNIDEFREQGLTKDKLKFYASPYTLYELGGLIKTLQALKESDFPKSQLYQIRSLLEQGKNTAILNYRYFRVRLQKGQTKLVDDFENAWCKPLTNDGNLAPWMSYKKNDDAGEEKTYYETIWRDLVDLYPFVVELDSNITENTKGVVKGALR